MNKKVLSLWIVAMFLVSLGTVTAFQRSLSITKELHDGNGSVSSYIKAPDFNLFRHKTSSVSQGIANQETQTSLGSDLEISNEFLMIHVYSDGGFTGKTIEGKWIFFPGDTSDFTIKIGDKEYDIYHGGLSQYLTGGPYISPENDKEAIVEWTLPEGIKVEEHILLDGDKVKFKIVIRNLNEISQTVSIRYLWDTQLEDNDGSPLEAKGQLYFFEQEFEPVDFNYWSAYSRPEHATLVTYSWWENVPTRMIFAHWPEAKNTIYYYDWDPNRRFYTPGYTTSPESDSCVLMYWENIEVPANGEKTITVYYGISKNINLRLRLNMERTTFYSGEQITIQAKPEDANGNTLYPMTSENTEVFFNDQRAYINSITPVGNGWYLIKVNAPTIPGDYTLTVTFTTPEGSASNSTTVTVFSDVNAEIFIDTSKNVDANTRNWKYPTHYNAPVYRRGIDTPIFGVNINTPGLQGYRVRFEVYAPNANDPAAQIMKIATLYSDPISSTPTSVSVEWNWNDPLRGICYALNSLPVGTYVVNYYLVKGENSIFLGTKYFYVIFDFKEEDQYFVTSSKEARPSPWGISNGYYSLDLAYTGVWKRALKWISGVKTIPEAVERISELARRIDGTMVFHHSSANEAADFGRHGPLGIFSGDGYDNDFDGQIDEEDENWEYDYRPNDRTGEAYRIEDGNVVWIDGKGNTYSQPYLAAVIAWYRSVYSMLRNDFDPENKVPHQHSLGVCEDYAMLTVAYMRGVGIKSRSVVGWWHKANGEWEGHAWTQWWNPDQNGWRHLDTDFSQTRDEWERNKYNPRWYYWDYGRFTHVWVNIMGFEDPHFIDIADQYNNPNINENTVFYDGGSGTSARGTPTFTSQLTTSTLTPLETNEEPTLQYHLPENETIVIGQENILNVTVGNPTDESRTVNITLAIYPLPPLERVNVSPIWNSTKEVVIPAHSTKTVRYTVTLPNTTFSGLYYLRVFENTTLMNETSINVVAPFTYEIQYNENNLILNKPSQFSIVVKNPTDVSMRNVTVILDLYHNFNTSDELIQQVSEIPPGSEHVFTWTLIPIEEETLMLGISIYTDNMGSVGETLYPRVLSPPRFHVKYDVKPEAIRAGEPFNLTLTIENYGDLDANDVTVKFVLPEGAEITILVDKIEAHTNKTLSIFNVPSESISDFSILVNITSDLANYTTYIPINVINPSLWGDILTSNENVTGNRHDEVVMIPVGEPYNFTIFLSNIGDVNLTNVKLILGDGRIVNVGTIEKGAIKTVPVQYTLPTAGLSMFNVTVQSDQLNMILSRPILGIDFDFNMSLSKLQYTPNETIILNITIMNKVPEVRFTDIQLKIELLKNGLVVWEYTIPILSLAPMEVFNTTLTIDTENIENGTYIIKSVLVIGEKEIYNTSENIIIGTEQEESTEETQKETEEVEEKSSTETYTNILVLSQLWTTWFFKYYDEFNELYTNATAIGIDNETLQKALELHNNATELIKEAWHTDNLDDIKAKLWKEVKILPKIVDIRRAFLKEKKAVEILREVIEKVKKS